MSPTTTQNWQFNPSIALSPAKLSDLHLISTTSVMTVVVPRRRIRQNRLKLSQLATNNICQLSGVLAASLVSHHSKQTDSTELKEKPLHKSTLTMMHTTLTITKTRTYTGSSNFQADLSLAFNSQWKNNTHFPFVLPHWMPELSQGNNQLLLLPQSTQASSES